MQACRFGGEWRLLVKRAFADPTLAGWIMLVIVASSWSGDAPGAGANAAESVALEDILAEARRAHGAGDYEACARTLRPVISPGNQRSVSGSLVAEADILYLQALRLAGNHEAVEAFYKSIPPDHPAWPALALEALQSLDQQGRSSDAMAFLAHADRMLTAPETRFPYVKILTRHALQLSRPRDLDALLQAIHQHGSNATLLCRVHYERGLWLLGAGQYHWARADFDACERLAPDARLKSASEFYILKCGLLLSEPEAARRAESLLADSIAPPNRDDLLIALIEHYARRAIHHDALRCCLFFEQAFRTSVTSPEYMHARLSALHGLAFASDPPDPLLFETVASYAYECAEVAVKTSHPAYLRYDLSCLLRT